MRRVTAVVLQRSSNSFQCTMVKQNPSIARNEVYEEMGSKKKDLEDGRLKSCDDSPRSSQAAKSTQVAFSRCEQVPQPVPLLPVSYSLETAVIVKKSGGTALLQGECTLKCLRTIRCQMCSCCARCTEMSVPKVLGTARAREINAKTRL
jgi:hypothetical protein